MEDVPARTNLSTTHLTQKAEFLSGLAETLELKEHKIQTGGLSFEGVILAS